METDEERDGKAESDADVETEGDLLGRAELAGETVVLTLREVVTEALGLLLGIELKLDEGELLLTADEDGHAVSDKDALGLRLEVPLLDAAADGLTMDAVAESDDDGLTEELREDDSVAEDESESVVDAVELGEHVTELDVDGLPDALRCKLNVRAAEKDPDDEGELLTLREKLPVVDSEALADSLRVAMTVAESVGVPLVLRDTLAEPVCDVLTELLLVTLVVPDSEGDTLMLENTEMLDTSDGEAFDVTESLGEVDTETLTVIAAEGV